MEFQRVAEAFSRARRLAPADRAAYLEGLDAAVRAEVQALLGHHDSEEGAEFRPLLQGAVPAAWEETAREPSPSLAGFRILRRIGSGAMGVVYEAEQESPRRRVAIKMLHVPTEEGRRRFEREARMLACLDHPGIARILAQGTEPTPQGPRPYLVMEMVAGVPLHEFARNLDRSGVLDLLRQVCAAVAHAHERGVIHRDLKPGNILVTTEGRAKVLDFGLARPVEGASLYTRTGNVLGTLTYMSPEQASGEPGAADTRSDVYALGVIAYELLAGHPPLDLEGMTMPEALRAIRFQDPPQLPGGGDLSWILSTAMSKEKGRRYSNAGALADDLERCAADEPVLARPPTTGYQLRKFVRRNRTLVAGAAATVLALLLGLVVAIVFAERARSEAARVRHVAALSQLQLAGSALASGEPAPLKLHLEAVPEGERGWAWRYLDACRDGSLSSVRQPIHVRWTGLFGGTRFVAAVDWRKEAAVLDTETGQRVPGRAPQAGGHYEGLCAGGGRAWFARSVPGGTRLESSDGRGVVTPGLTPGSSALAADPSGRLLAYAARAGGSKDFTLVLLDVDSGAARWRRPLGPHEPACMAFSADGARLALGVRPAELQVYDAKDGHRRFARRIDSQDIFCIALDEEGRRLAVGLQDHSVELFDGDTGVLRHRLTGHRAAVDCVAFDPRSGLLVSGSRDRTLRLWDTRSGACVRVLLGHSNWVTAVGFQPDGGIVSVGRTRIRTWTREDPDVIRAHKSFAQGNPDPYVYGVAYRPDGAQLATCGWDGTARVFDATSHRRLAVFDAPCAVRAVAYSPDGKWLAFSHVRIEVRDAHTGALRGFYGKAAEGRERLVFLPDSRHLAASRVGMVELIDLDSGDVREWPAGRSSYARVAVSPDGALLAHEVGHGSVAVRRVSDGTVVRRFHAAYKAVDDLAFSPDGTILATAGDNSTVHLWSVRSGRELASLHGHTTTVYAVAFSPDGRWLASGSEGHRIRIWDVARREERLVLTGHRRYVFDLAFSPDGATLASASGDDTVRIWSTRPLREREKRARTIDEALAKLRAKFPGEGSPETMRSLDDLSKNAESWGVRRAASDLEMELGSREGKR